MVSACHICTEYVCACMYLYTIHVEKAVSVDHHKLVYLKVKLERYVLVLLA